MNKKLNYFKLFEQKKSEKLKTDAKKILILEIDLRNEKVNKLTEAVMLELDGILDDLYTRAKKNKDVALLLIRSGKLDNFIAGADINEIRNIDDKESARQKMLLGQGVFAKLEGLSFPTVAIISGACLGGGLELALSCSYLVATDNSKTKMGLPEVNLGIIPGFGGTYRLPRRIGIARAIPLIVAGKIIDAKKAYRLGLVDKILHEEYLEMHLHDFLQAVLYQPGKIKRQSKQPTRLQKFLSEGNMISRAIMFSLAKKSIVKRTHRFYPAPLSALEVLRKSARKSAKRALACERKGFLSVVNGEVSNNLIELFFNSEALKKDAGIDFNKESQVDTKKEIDLSLSKSKVGVLGAGIMGGGIAWLFSYKDMRFI